MSTMKFNVQQEIWSGAIALRIAVKTESGLAVARSITFEQIKPNEITDPVLNMTQEDAQLLADALYGAGIRPTAAAGSAGQLDAVKNHLEDMRTLVFKRGNQ